MAIEERDESLPLPVAGSALLPLASRGWGSDGWPHTRDETGFCTNCGARRGEYHYRLVPKADAIPASMHEGNSDGDD